MENFKFEFKKLKKYYPLNGIGGKFATNLKIKFNLH